MINISKSDIELFKQHGWVQVPMNLNLNEITYYRESIENLKKKAIDEHFPLRIIYWPYLNDINIAAIESPFNGHIINDGIKGLFSKICLGNAVKKLMGWIQ